MTATARPVPPPPVHASAGPDPLTGPAQGSGPVLGVVADFMLAEPVLPLPYPCAECEQPIAGVPVSDAGHVAVFGYEAAAKFCDELCLAAYAEANAT